MKFAIPGVVATLLLLCGAAPAAAQAGNDYYSFTLFNGTPWTILTFQTGEPNGTYSRDWMPQRVLEPGDQVALRFHDSEEACEYYVKIVFEDGDAWQQKLDFCALESVVVNEDGVIEGIE